MSTDFIIETDDFVTPDHTASERQAPPVTGESKWGAFTKPRRVTADKPAPKPPKVRTVEPASKPGEFTQPIADFYRLAAAVVMPFDPNCAGVVLDVIDDPESKDNGKDRAQLCAEALDEAAQKSEGLRRTLRAVTVTGVWGKVFAAHAPILVAAMMHHTPFMERVTRFQTNRMEAYMRREEARMHMESQIP